MYKQVIIVRKDLKMSVGKISAQSSHASLSAYQKVMKTDEKIAKEWEREGLFLNLVLHIKRT